LRLVPGAPTELPGAEAAVGLERARGGEDISKVSLFIAPV